MVVLKSAGLIIFGCLFVVYGINISDSLNGKSAEFSQIPNSRQNTLQYALHRESLLSIGLS